MRPISLFPIRRPTPGPAGGAPGPTDTRPISSRTGRNPDRIADGGDAPRSASPGGHRVRTSPARHERAGAFRPSAPGLASDLSPDGRGLPLHVSAAPASTDARSPVVSDHDASALPESALPPHGGWSLSVPDAGRLGDPVPGGLVTEPDLADLVARLHRAAQHAGCVARGTEILAALMQRGLPLQEPCQGMAQAVQRHEEQAQVLADACAFVVRCAAQPDFLTMLTALERGEEVIAADTHDASVLPVAISYQPARAVVVGDLHHATSPARVFWSRVFDFVLPGHRKSSGPAHHVVPPDTSGTDHRSDPRCRDSHPSSRENVPSVTRVA
ncbi:hypothetical protein Mnod_5789 [Methylobacterium nodulans ORS 2060]|uniref:Uncharacterized protein n=1 Tax=Methylobacterium nodulans (strain LMG 21967 / CNCM I-2342 / ORS 2060) TaxID=460265 RepID=B8IRR8_METNO|nr:hypothetical protein Mnod_5789 [Methylobacterium nodulans ORS 2060]